MSRYDDRYGNTRLYVGRLSSYTRSRDLDDLFSRYGRVRDVDMKRDYAFVEFSDPRDADYARHRLDGREFDGSRLIVEFAKGHPRGRSGGGSSEYLGRGPPPGAGRCFNCGIDGHWAKDCKAGDWKNKCYRCGERGHIERNCQNSPKSLKRGRSYSRSPSPRPRRSRRSRSRSRSFTRSRSYSYSRSRSPARRRRERSRDLDDRRSRSPPPKARKERSPSPDNRKSPKDGSLSPVRDDKKTDEDGSPMRNGSRSPSPVVNGRSPSPVVNGRSPNRSPRPNPEDYNADDGNEHDIDKLGSRSPKNHNADDGDERDIDKQGGRSPTNYNADDGDERDVDKQGGRGPEDYNGDDGNEEDVVGKVGSRSPSPQG